MTDLITEARELCDKATPGPWEVKFHNEDFGQGYGETTFFVDMGGTLLKIGIAEAAEKYAKYNALSAFISRSRTLIPELCDALEKAEEQNKQFVRGVSALAAESVKRDVALARLEAEVMAMMEDKP